MARPRRKHSERDVALIDRAIGHLGEARKFLADAGAKRAADAVRRALKSAQGADRHARARRLDQ